jgi:hypothetical protein
MRIYAIYASIHLQARPTPGVHLLCGAKSMNPLSIALRSRCPSYQTSLLEHNQETSNLGILKTIPRLERLPAQGL